MGLLLPFFSLSVLSLLCTVRKCKNKVHINPLSNRSVEFYILPIDAFHILPDAAQIKRRTLQLARPHCTLHVFEISEHARFVITNSHDREFLKKHKKVE